MTLPRGVDQKIFQPPSFIAELDQFLPVTTGSSQIATKRVQEYLTLRGFRLSIDGDFGPATVNQLKSFQRSASLPDTGYYDVLEHDILSKPFLNALRAPDNSSLDFGATVVDIARQHIIECPKEVGGQNSGPWVRLYMDGHDGAPYLWCAGFCFFILSQACWFLQRKLPMQKTFSVDVIAERAKTSDTFVKGSNVRVIGRDTTIPPGSLFIVRSDPHSWSHVGIVTKHDGDVIHTCEGNTNDGGSSNGYEAIERVRSLDGKDFVCWNI